MMRLVRSTVVCTVLLVSLCILLLFSSAIFLRSGLWDNRFKDTFDGGNQNLDLTLTRTVDTSGSLIEKNVSCNHYSCFDVYRCNAHGQHRLAVYVYPIEKFVDQDGLLLTNPLSTEFVDLLEAVRRSRFYVPLADDACVFLPAVDVLNQNRLRLRETGYILKALSWWGNSGRNHLLFNMLPGSGPDYNSSLDVPTGDALLAGAGFVRSAYRNLFDISIPMYNPLLRDWSSLRSISDDVLRSWLLLCLQLVVPKQHDAVLLALSDRFPASFLRVHECAGSDDATRDSSVRCDRLHRSWSYPDVLLKARFCLVFSPYRFGQTDLSDAMQFGCIPVVVCDACVLPFAEVLDWKRAAVMLYTHELPHIVDIVRSFPDAKVQEMHRMVRLFWSRYFSSMERIALTTLEVLNDRVFPYNARSYEAWHEMEYIISPPLTLPREAPKEGFTAVVLTYDRLLTLYKSLRVLATAPSLVKVVVVWNNPKKSPPPEAEWPKLKVPIVVLRMQENKLSNRFYPYAEIETEAVLALDDDITPLNTDELEFGYQTWRQHSQHLVGYPSRLHVWSNASRTWQYDSEWSSQTSVILTGAAFYHKFYHHLFTNRLPPDVKSFVDTNMNCDDIAMNFLIANFTGKPGIKVTPRKKFRCPECTTIDLSTDASHMAARSACIDRFVRVFGDCLKTVEFRADPTLYKATVPDSAKEFANIGFL